MFKYLLILTSILGTTFLDYVFNDVTVYAKFPTEVIAGDEFEVAITVEKGNLSQFARFSQTLPQGFIATSEDKGFSFKNQEVRFIWITLPVEESYVFKYKVLVPTDFSGELEMGGKYGYVLDNEKKFAEIVPKKITVKPSSTPRDAINSSEQYASSGKNEMPIASNITSYRSIEILDNTAIVTIETNKGTLSQMAKITETIPNGYTAEEIDSNEGIFTFANNKIKYLWMNVPDGETFSVQYKLKKNDDSALNSKIPIEGIFSYSVNNLTQNVTIIDKPNDNTSDQNLAASTTFHIDAFQPEKNSDVTYRIQIAAGHKLVNIKKYFKKFKLNEDVSVDLHQGWHKYTIGSYYDYRSARNARLDIWNRTTIDDAFVTAYNNGIRITVQEALMIANQKWYK